MLTCISDSFFGSVLGAQRVIWAGGGVWRAAWASSELLGASWGAIGAPGSRSRLPPGNPCFHFFEGWICQRYKLKRRILNLGRFRTMTASVQNIIDFFSIFPNICSKTRRWIYCKNQRNMHIPQNRCPQSAIKMHPRKRVSGPEFWSPWNTKIT